MALRQHADAWALVFPLGGLMNEGRFFFYTEKIMQGLHPKHVPTGYNKKFRRAPWQNKNMARFP
jgi:hypothetical protein